MTEGYCDKCKARLEILNPLEDTLKDGRRCVRGNCPECGAAMFKMIKTPDVAAEVLGIRAVATG
jgi:RNase P subunit RPR2